MVVIGKVQHLFRRDKAPWEATNRRAQPAAGGWQSIIFLGRYAFHAPRQPIDLDALLAAANLL
jgi:hypothetical protein